MKGGNIKIARNFVNGIIQPLLINTEFTMIYMFTDILSEYYCRFSSDLELSALKPFFGILIGVILYECIVG